jgi:pyrroloquinoline-quinone synthase
MSDGPWPQKSFTAKLRKVGDVSYHHNHPFHRLMNSGKLDRHAIRAWVANRFYYQVNIPIKDAAILSNCPFRDVRRSWLRRIVDHDGTAGDEGGIGAWLQLGRACGLSREALMAETHVVPGVRYAVDAYVHFARSQPWPVAVASSLTELFAPDLMAKRLEAFQRYYKWIDPAGLEYFRRRLVQAPRDSAEALKLTLAHCATLELQQAALRALQFKCDLLWAMLDAIHSQCFGLANAPAKKHTQP